MTRWLAVIPVAFAIAAPARADDKLAVVEIDGLKSQAPAAWKKVAPPERLASMRLAQFKIDKAAGDPADGELIVFYFGKGKAGTLEANLKRWKEQFEPPAGEKATVTKFTVSGADVTLLDIQGTFLDKPPGDQNAPTVKKPDYRAVQVYFASPNGPYTIRLLGPAKTVEGQRKAFEEWVKNFK